MTRILVVVTLLSAASVRALGSAGSEFYIEEGLVSKIFEQVSHPTVPRSAPNSFITPMVGMIRPSVLTVENSYFATDYRQLGSLPYLYLNAGLDLARSRQSRLLGTVSIGYGYRQQKVDSRDSSGLSVSDTVSMQWLPLEFGGEVSWSGFAALPIVPSFGLALGRIWVRQDGNIDGMAHGVFHTYASVGTTLKIGVADDISVVVQGSLMRGIAAARSRYEGFRVGVGTWLAI